jgi:aryl-alcohol dehydrogenase
VPARSQPFEIQQLELAAPLEDEVLVRILASGMCHTDLHARDGYFPNLPYPIVCGHEGAGIVEAVGAAVADLARFRIAANASRAAPAGSPIAQMRAP